MMSGIRLEALIDAEPHGHFASKTNRTGLLGATIRQVVAVVTVLGLVAACDSSPEATATRSRSSPARSVTQTSQIAPKAFSTARKKSQVPVCDRRRRRIHDHRHTTGKMATSCPVQGLMSPSGTSRPTG